MDNAARLAAAEAVLEDNRVAHNVSCRSLKQMREEAASLPVGSIERDAIEYWIPAAEQNVNDLADKMDAAIAILGWDVKMARS